MHFDVTSLVNNVILPQTETDDIIGRENLEDVSLWLYLPDCEARHLAIGYKGGSILTMILIETQVFIGLNTIPRVDVDVNTVTARIESHQGFKETSF